MAVPMAWPTYSRTTLNPAPFGDGLHRGADVVQAIAVLHLGDPGPQAVLGHPDQLLGVGADVADADGVGGVAVVALDDGATVDRQDVAVLQAVVAWDAVDDHGVGRGADDRREAVVAEEVRPGASTLEHLRGPPGRGRAVVTPGRAAARVAACISATTRPARRILVISSWLRLTGLSNPHTTDLCPCRPRPQSGRLDPMRDSSTTLTRRVVTSSGDPIPSTGMSVPRALYQAMSGAVSRS